MGNSSYYQILLKHFLRYVPLMFLFASPLYAQTVPSVAEADRVIVDPPNPVPDKIPEADESQKGITYKRQQAPAGSENIEAEFKTIDIEGASPDFLPVLHVLAEPYLNKKTTLDKLWDLANDITDYYRDNGYFLSFAYVPKQKITSGNVKISVIEGYVGSVDIQSSDDKKYDYDLLKSLIRDIESRKPLSATDLEEFALRVNDLPGIQTRLIVKQEEKKTDPGRVTLVLIPSEEKSVKFVSVDNYDSRFLGPFKAIAGWNGSFIPLVQSNLSLAHSLEEDELFFGNMNHRIALSRRWFASFYASHVRTQPGSTIERNDINNTSTVFGGSIGFQPIRQRRENLSFTLGFEHRKVDGDIFSDAPLTRDNIRLVRLTASYDTDDALGGYNYLTLGFDHGLKVLGASKAGQANLSRAEADPEFRILSANLVRQQPITQDFFLVNQGAVQFTQDPLFSSGEFGYGGNNFGRAFDPSEIIGDNGAAISFELRYFGLNDNSPLNIVPYTFYDFGHVWNEDSANSNEVTASSAGAGARFLHSSGFSADIGLAFPLIKEIEFPQYGNDKNPRLLFQTRYVF
ncbi:MAG: ShlB/FhaC/HecB family hemolysin secretion/activation protein [Pseudomonadota bacterium]